MKNHTLRVSFQASFFFSLSLSLNSERKLWGKNLFASSPPICHSMQNLTHGDAISAKRHVSPFELNLTPDIKMCIKLVNFACDEILFVHLKLMSQSWLESWRCSVVRTTRYSTIWTRSSKIQIKSQPFVFSHFTLGDTWHFVRTWLRTIIILYRFRFLHFSYFQILCVRIEVLPLLPCYHLQNLVVESPKLALFC